MDDLNEKWITLEEATEYTNIGKTNLYTLAQQGRIPASKVGKKWSFEVKKLDEWLRANKSIENFFTQTPANVENNFLLRDPQREGYTNAYNYFRNGGKEALLQIPVGCGKSGLISILPFGIAKGRVLVISPNLPIKDELYDSLDITNKQKCFWIRANILNDEDMFAGPYVCSLDEINLSVVEKAHFVVTNIQQLSTNIDKWLNKFSEDYFDMIIVDEAHHNPADSWQKVFMKFKRAKVVNLTATPFRSDRQEISGDLIYRYSFKSATIKGYIKRVKASYVTPEKLTFTAKNETHTYSLEEVLEMKEEEWFSKGIAMSEVCNKSIVENSLEKLEELRLSGTKHQIIAVACSIDHAKQIRSLYKERGYTADIIHSNLKKEEQERVIRDLKSGILDCIVQVQMLGEGFDHPKLSVAAIFRPYRTLNPYIQFVGRILRVIVQNSPSHPDNKGFIVTHIGLNLDGLVKKFKDFENDDKSFWEDAITEETKEEESERKKKSEEFRRIKPIMVVHDEIVENLVEEDFVDSSDFNDVKGALELAMENLGIDPKFAEEVMKKNIKDDLKSTVSASKGFKVNIQTQWKEAKKRLNEQVGTHANILLHNTKLSRTSRELVNKFNLGANAQNNYIAAVQLLNAQVNKTVPGERKRAEWTLEEFKNAQAQLPDITVRLVRQIIKVLHNE